MVYFRRIVKTQHFVQYHEPNVPWSEVVRVIFTASKTAKKVGNMIRIDDGKYYVLCRLERNKLFIINAKRKR